MTMAIITIFLFGSTYIFSVGLNATGKNKIKFTARNLAKDMMEEVLSKEHWKKDGACGVTTLVAESGESRFGTTADTVYDDVDDYNTTSGTGYSEAPPRKIDVMAHVTGAAMNEYIGFKREVKVEYVNPNTFSTPVLPSPEDKICKKITVNIYYDPQLAFPATSLVYSIIQVVTKT